MKRSATACITCPLAGRDMLATAATMKPEAAKRLGGDDGLSCIAAQLLDDGTVAATWRREWDQPDPEAKMFAEDV